MTSCRFVMILLPTFLPVKDDDDDDNILVLARAIDVREAAAVTILPEVVFVTEAKASCVNCFDN